MKTSNSNQSFEFIFKINFGSFLCSTVPQEQGMGNLCSFAPTNASSDCWSAANSYNFNIRAKSMQQIKSNLIGWEETNDLALSLSCFYGFVRKGGGVRKRSNLEQLNKSDIRGRRIFFQIFFKSSFSNFSGHPVTFGAQNLQVFSQFSIYLLLNQLHDLLTS